jgi:hypothetical protein
MTETKKDHYIDTFMGTTYNIGNPQTVGELRSILEKIVSDLPTDKSLKISEVDLRDGNLDYTLVDGITQ